MKAKQIMLIAALIVIVMVLSVAGTFLALQGQQAPAISTPTPFSVPTATQPPTPTTAPTAIPSPKPTVAPTQQPTTAPATNPIPTTVPTATPSQIGYSRLNPASTNTPLTIEFEWLGKTYTAKITLTDTIRGTEAWNQIHVANMYNDPPETGHEYILAKIRFEYLSGPTADTTYDISDFKFDAFSATGVKYESVAIVCPDPQLDTTLYPGGSCEGWGCYQIAQSDSNPVLAFGRGYGGAGGIWFKLGW